MPESSAATPKRLEFAVRVSNELEIVTVVPQVKYWWPNWDMSGARQSPLIVRFGPGVNIGGVFCARTVPKKKKTNNTETMGRMTHRWQHNVILCWRPDEAYNTVGFMVVSFV